MATTRINVPRFPVNRPAFQVQCRVCRKTFTAHGEHRGVCPRLACSTASDARRAA
ncbi:MAG: hypothetical protein M3N43_06945 [Actinomycetota bacterium]|nr:hypothetical protein [Actinomycetota bacterium]